MIRTSPIQRRRAGEAVGPIAARDSSDAAAAADDTHPGLDLPLLTFSCIVGIKLSQATYYLRSQDLVAALLAQLADCASVSQDD